MTVAEPYQVPLAIDLAAVAVGAVQGTLTGLERKDEHAVDLLGVVALALVLGFGGGVIRDVLLAQIPAALRSNSYILTVLVATAATLLVGPRVRILARAVDALDPVVLGLFACVGALKGQEAGLAPFGVLLLGTLAGTGGGILRDLLLRETPRIMRPGELYAVPAALAVVVLVGLTKLGLPVGLEVTIATAACVAFRFLAIWLGWETKPVYEQAPWWRRQRADEPPAGGPD